MSLLFIFHNFSFILFSVCLSVNASILTGKQKVHTLHKPRKCIPFENHMVMGRRAPISVYTTSNLSIQDKSSQQRRCKAQNEILVKCKTCRI